MQGDLGAGCPAGVDGRQRPEGSMALKATGQLSHRRTGPTVG